MRRLAYVILIACCVVVALFLFYLILGRPPIPLPAFHYTVSQGNGIYDEVAATDEKKMTITWATNGRIEALADGDSMIGINYDMNSLGVSMDLAIKYRDKFPQNIQSLISRIEKLPLIIREILKTAGEFFYYIIRLKFTLVISAK